MKRLFLMVFAFAFLFLFSSCGKPSPFHGSFDECYDAYIELEAKYDELLGKYEELWFEQEIYGGRIISLETLVSDVGKTEDPLCDLYSYFEDRDISFEKAYDAYEKLSDLLRPYY